MAQSEESMTLMTPYHPSSFRAGGKNALWKKREMAIWHRVKNLLLGWRLIGFLHHGSRSFTFASDDV